MTILTRCIMDLFKQSKKSRRGFPSFSIMPRVRPKAMQKTSRPSILIPSEWPGTGALSTTRVSVMYKNSRECSFKTVLKQTTCCNRHKTRHLCGFITRIKRNLTVVTCHIDDTMTVSCRNVTGIKCFMLDQTNKQGIGYILVYETV